MRIIVIVAVCGTLMAEKVPSPAEKSWSVLDTGIVSQSTAERAKAVRALGLIRGNDKARELAEKALSDTHYEVQAAAASALGQMGAKSSVPKLVGLVKTTQSMPVAFEAANAVYVLGDPRAYEFYYAVLTGERKTGEGLVDSQMKLLKDTKAMAAMGVSAGLGFVPFGSLGYGVFKSVTKDDPSPVRAAAAQKLIKDDDSKTADALMSAAADEKWLVRAAVIDAIAKRDDPRFVKALIPRLDDENDAVRYTAAAAVIRLAGGKILKRPPAAPHR